MAQQHHEAMMPSWTRSAWALILVSDGMGDTIVAGSFGIWSDVQEIGNNPAEIGLPYDIEATGSAPGFYLWEGTVSFDGLDGIDYDGNAKHLTWEEAKPWFDKGAEAPEADTSTDGTVTLLA
jgi:hypothetical protein